MNSISLGLVAEALDYVSWESDLIAKLQDEPVLSFPFTSSVDLGLGLAWEYYAKAMSRRREPLSEERFVRHFSRQDGVAYGDIFSGWLLGSQVGDLFAISHFAPASMRSGVKLLEALAGESIKSVMMVTDDLVGMLDRISGWHLIASGIPMTFRDEVVMKTVFVNDCLFSEGRAALFQRMGQLLGR